MKKSPFKFLDSYTKLDREIYFGRDREIEELYQKVFDSKLLLVYGVSGTGKSSLINCGLANKFLETDWLPLEVRRGGNILDSMTAVIKLASITKLDNQFETTGNFKKALKSLYLDHYRPIFFIFDQFEELFIYGDKEERKSFIRIIKSLLESDLQCRFIFIMREEYMAGVTEFERDIPTFFANRIRIEKMSNRNALEAIKEPCKVLNITLEENFAENLLEKLGPGGKDVELTYLQVFLDKVFRLAENESGDQEGQKVLSFTLSLLNKVGKVSDLLGNFLEDQISLMEDPDDAMTVMKAFVSGKGTKKPADETEAINNVCSLGKVISPEKVKEYIRSFVNLRVLRDKDDNGKYELRHDSLAEKIFEKFSTTEKELLEIRQMIENAFQYYLKRNILLSNDDLNYISGKDSLMNLNPELKIFLETSRKHQQNKIRTVKRLTFASAAMFFFMLIVLGYYDYIKVTRFKANNLAIKSVNQIPDPIEALNLAGHAWKKYQGVLQKEALFKSINSIGNYPQKDSILKNLSPSIIPVFDPAPHNIETANCSKDDRYVFGYGDSLIFIWNSNGKLERIIKAEHYPLVDMKLSDDGHYMGAISSDSLLTVWDSNGEKQSSIKINFNELNQKQMFKFTKDNNIAILSKDHDFIISNPSGKILQKFNKHKGKVNALDLSNDNKFIATASSDNSINIWYFNSVKKRYDFYNNINWHKNIVWSVAFSKSDLNIISTSADSATIVGNINNQIYYSIKGKNSFCFAEFTPNDRGLITTGYTFDNESIGRMSYAHYFRTPVTEIRNKYSISGNLPENDSGDFHLGFSYITFSNDDHYYICGDEDSYYLMDNWNVFENEIKLGWTLMEIKGSHPFFSHDGKYILSPSKMRIRVYIIDLEAITEITEKLAGLID
jgi:WD40 repeat protein